MKIGGMCLRTVGQVTFLEDSNGIISVDIAKLVRPSKANDDISNAVAAQFIADAVNYYAKALYEESLNVPDEEWFDKNNIPIEDRGKMIPGDENE